MMKHGLRGGGVAVLTMALLCACGGGLYVGVGVSTDDDDNAPPVVSLVASQNSARAGDLLKLVVAAADASGIDEVAFYRLDAGVPTLLGTDVASPFEWQEVVPFVDGSTLSYFVRATDRSGQRGDSNTVTVSVSP